MTTFSASASVPSVVPSASTACPPCWHDPFLKMLPKIERHARIVFRDRKGDSREEAVQEAVCSACCAFARLVEQSRAESATWSSLAKYAVAQVRAGRRVGTSQNVCDVSSDQCRLRKGVGVGSLHRWDSGDEEWTEMAVEDRRSTPADVAAFRIDFRAFLRSLKRRDREIAVKLAEGHATSWVAARFKVSAGRVSQLRRELYEAWRRLHGEPVPA